MRFAAILAFAFALPLQAAPRLLDDQFNLPEGFHIYKAAEAELTGGSYDLVFDGRGRLLVGDGANLRRLEDTDGDQVYDKAEVIAEGLGGRGPQGLVVYGDHVYAVGGDGMQLFSGYRAGGKLKHEGRLGAPFSTGGDHAAHTVIRGLDGYLYHVTGDGGGVGERKHITEESSPVLYERNASVFRFDPTGEHWECIAAGGRNPPSLGMNYLGEFFSFDSDMEWHVDLPFYRPVRLNHWATGGDNGWQGVGAYPPYYLDCLPGVLEVGRGSPDWGVFYEHTQFPENYRDAFLVCDYQWKSATSGGYANPGRIVAFHLERKAATWSAEMTLLAQPKQDAVDESGRRINFGLVDVDVAPDGSIVITDHNQGVWRIFYDPSPTPEIPSLVLPPRDIPEIENPLERLLNLPQPIAEWTRVEEERILEEQGDKMSKALHEAALDQERPLRLRLRALRLLAPNFKTLDSVLLARLARDPAPEMRGQAAWLAGLRMTDARMPAALLRDKDPFVRRRAAEAFTRFGSAQAMRRLIELLSDEDRFVRYAAMTALAHRPSGELLAEAEKVQSPHAIMRLLVACEIRRERPPAPVVQGLVARLLESGVARSRARQDVLDLFRVLGLFGAEIAQSEPLRARVAALLTREISGGDKDIRWEQIRLLGQYDVAAGIAPLLAELEKEEDGVTQFHLADALARISQGWNDQESLRLVRWLLSTQTGWFAELNGKGLQFGGFWNTVVNQLASRHTAALMVLADELKPDSELAKVAYQAIRTAPDADKVLLKAFEAAKSEADRERLIGLLQEVRSPLIAGKLLSDLEAAPSADRRAGLIAALAAQPLPPEKLALFVRGLVEINSPSALERCANRILSEGKAFPDYGESVKSLTIGEVKGEQAIAYRLLELMAQHPQLESGFERALQVLTAHQRPSFRAPMQILWTSDRQNADERAWFARSFEIAGKPTGGTLVITCDNEFEAFLNGKKVGAGQNWQSPQRIAVGEALVEGRNIIAIEGFNQSGPAGLGAILRWSTTSGNQTLSTDTTWKVASARPPKGWESSGAEAGNWGAPMDVSVPTKNVAEVMAAFIENAPLVTSAEVQEYWQTWYRNRFGQPYLARVTASKTEAWSDEDLHALLAGMKEFKGDAARGRQVYLKTTCFACHGGLGDQAGTLFGPPLAGVTARLNRQELADAIVFPSKQVSDRFKASEVATTEGKTINGFLTEQSDDFISVTDVQNQVTRLPRTSVKSIKSQDQSLMPPKLLNSFGQEEIVDLMTFIHELK